MELMQHQKDAIAMSYKLKDMALFWEMGTGKTCATINILRHRYGAHNKLLRTLILAPLVVCRNWKLEFNKFSKIKDVLVLDKAGKKRIQLMEKNIDRDCIIVTNYQALLNSNFYSALVKWAPDIVVLDESHLCKNPKSKIA